MHALKIGASGHVRQKSAATAAVVMVTTNFDWLEAWPEVCWRAFCWPVAQGVTGGCPAK